MAWEYPILQAPGGIAGADFSGGGTTHGLNSTGQFLFVKLSADDTYVPCSSVTDLPVGISQTNPKSGDALAVMVIGISKVVLGGTVVAGDEVGTDANGNAVVKAATATGANFGQFVRAVALEGGSAGQVVPVLLTGPYKV